MTDTQQLEPGTIIEVERYVRVDGDSAGSEQWVVARIGWRGVVLGAIDEAHPDWLDVRLDNGGRVLLQRDEVRVVGVDGD